MQPRRPSRNGLPFRVLAAVAILAACGRADDAEPPYGHPDFYPTPERPAGLQGDGSGHFPGARPVTEWDFRTGKNIVWRTMLPNWGYSSPIVVGDKVFVTTDWNRLLCLDARDGRILWQRDNWTFDLVADGDRDKAAALRKAWDGLVNEHSKAWACCWEIAYLTWKLDVIRAAKTGQEFKWPSRGYGHSGEGHGGNNMARDHLTDAELKQVTARLKALGDEEVAAIERRLAELAKLREEKRWAPHVSGYVPTLSPYERGKEKELADKPWEVYHKVLIPRGLFTDMWNGWLGTSFATPVSDGEHVWALFGQCQVVCYDLDGRRKWIKVHLESGRKRVGWRTAQNFSASPILADEKLITIFGGQDKTGSTVRAFDKRTGELLWAREVTRGHGEGHPFWQVRRVLYDGIDALVVGNSMVLATADGSVIIEGLVSLVAPPLVHEDRVFLISGNGECGNGVRYGLKLYRDGPAVKARVLWGAMPSNTRTADSDQEHIRKNAPAERIIAYQGEVPGSSVGCCYHDGRILCGGNPALVFDPDTGKEIPPAEPPKRSRWRRVGQPRGHLIRAGDYLFSQTGYCGVIVRALGDPANILAVNDIGSEWQRRLQLLQMPPDEMARVILDRHFMPYYSNWSMMQSTPYAQGERLYMRTRDTLYCVGDPARPYHSPSRARAGPQ